MPTKATIKSLFTAIREGNEAVVRSLVAGDPSLVHARRSAPPKKDDGQSPLQVALKTGQFAIADYFIDHGADVNFMEESVINEWQAPALHDAIRAAAMNMPVANIGNAQSFSTAITLLKRMLKQGANPNARDSFGNNCLMRALLDLRIRLTSIPIVDAIESESHPNFDQGARTLLGALIDGGADIHAANESRESAFEYSRMSYFARFFRTIKS